MLKKLQLLAKANLVMSKAHIAKRQETDRKGNLVDKGKIEEFVDKVTFDIVEKEADVIKTPRIDLDGSFFSDFLTSGRVGQYEVVMTIEARRTKLDPRGIPATIEEIPPEGPPLDEGEILPED